MAPNPTVFPAEPFDPVQDSKDLKQAFKGFGTDEQAVIDIITKRTNAQRQQIFDEFKTMYGKDLIKELKSELRGNFEDVIIALMTPPVLFQAKQLHKAISGLGTDESALVEILGIHNNAEIHAIREAYEENYKSNMEKDIKGDTSGTLKRLFVSLSVGGRDESGIVDQEKTFKDAQDLLRAGELLFAGTDESVFNQVLCQRNRYHVQEVFVQYEKLVGHPFDKAIENEFSGTTKDILLDLVSCIRNPVEYLAQKLHKSMEGMGTDDKTLIRIVVSRSEIDLGDIKVAFERKYGKTLAEFIQGDTSGDYKKCLLSIVN